MVDRDAIVREWTLHQHAVGVFISCNVRDFHDANDILQQVAVEILSKPQQYDVSRPFLPWALGVARNQIANFRRRRGDSRLLFDSEIAERLAGACAETEGTMESMRDALQACMQSIPGPSRKMLELRYWEGKSMDGIAQAVGRSVDAVKMAIHRIRAALYHCIEQRLIRENGLRQ